MAEEIVWQTERKSAHMIYTYHINTRKHAWCKSINYDPMINCEESAKINQTHATCNAQNKLEFWLDIQMNCIETVDNWTINWNVNLSVHYICVWIIKHLWRKCCIECEQKIISWNKNRSELKPNRIELIQDSTKVDRRTITVPSCGISSQFTNYHRLQSRSFFNWFKPIRWLFIDTIKSIWHTLVRI